MLLPKVLALSSSVALAIPASARSVASPRRVAFESLRDGAAPGELLLGGLTTDGLVSITDIPSFGDVRAGLASNFHACIASVGEDVVPSQHYRDGSTRRSIAASTAPGAGGRRPIGALEEIEALSGGSASEPCRELKELTSSFRTMVDEAMEAFAARLSAEMGGHLSKPIMSTSTGKSASVTGRDYDDIRQVVEGGEHLEHFHSYQKVEGPRDEAGNDEPTIEFHTDQGFFIAFTPGLIVSSDPSEKGLELSDGFYIRDSNGQEVMMEFKEDDHLVFMLGDGVNQ